MPLACGARLKEAGSVRVGWFAVLILAACHSGGRGDEVRAAPPIPASSAWAGASASGLVAESMSARAERGDPDALAELVRAASARAATSAAPLRTPGGDTRLPGSGDVDLAASDPHSRAGVGPAASASAPRVAGAGNDAIERSARAQLYWELTQRCKDEHDAILPPESVEVMFDVDDEGYLVTSTISAIAKSPPFERAALCMRREVARSGYRAPPAARGAVTHIKLWVPSTD
jgi:hypothetical protein